MLYSLPSVAAFVPDPSVEGVPSEAFPGVLRKTDRELYRWIANTHYEHLADAVAQLERVCAAGCLFASLLRTRDREQFENLIPEVLVADDLLRRGYTVKAFPRSHQATPDLRVLGRGIDVAVEIYSPRELLAVDAWVKEVNDLLNYVDVRASYSSRVTTAVEPPIPPELSSDPWAPAKMLAQSREAVIADISRDVEDALRKLEPLCKVYRHAGTSLLTTVELDDVRMASELGPTRNGTFSYPGFGGYSPSGVFRKIVRRSLRKAKERQTQGVPATARVLVVYLMGTKIADDLAHPVHMNEAKIALDGIEPKRYGLDAIVFVVRALPRGLAALFMVVDDATLTIPQVQAMFDPAP